MKFRIFHPSGWPRIQNMIGWSSMGIGFLLIFLSRGSIKPFDLPFFLYMFLAAGVPILIMILGFITYEPLNGQIYGYLIFGENEIKIENQTFAKNKIDSIKLLFFSYEGQLKARGGKLNFKPAMSSGTDNSLTIKTNSGQSKTIRFQIENQQNLVSLKKFMDKHYFEKYRYDSIINAE